VFLSWLRQEQGVASGCCSSCPLDLTLRTGHSPLREIDRTVAVSETTGAGFEVFSKLKPLPRLGI
jgi:hypothetical protein